jgi:glutathionyl-hydroquinone reductase
VTNAWNDTSTKGAFVRKDSVFRDNLNDVTDPGRYHLYVSLACPWAHRTLITRALKGLEHAISVDVVDHQLTDKGWTFGCLSAGATRDRVNGFATLREVYEQSDPGYGGRITVPVLYDKHERRIVNNESSEIIRMLDRGFGGLAGRPEPSLRPPELASEIDGVNAWIYPQINNGVYKSGFAKTQGAYDEAVTALFEGLDRAEALLANSTYLVGGRLTEADIRLFTTLVRFDLVYYSHFKCSVRRITDYPALWRFTRTIYQMPEVRPTVDFTHIREHYFWSHRSVNPTGIVPRLPDISFDAPV